jgi:diguanylate cyclase (GGDEF)-like protein
MDILESIKQRLKQNEVTAKKFHEIEISILSVLNFQDLCESLLTEISDKFDIPLVWLSIIEDNSISEHIKSIKGSGVLKSKTCFLKRKDFKQITGISITTDIKSIIPLLINNDIDQFNRLFPSHIAENIGSLAIVPITMDGLLIGSLNLGDRDAQRFEPGIDTSLLEQLCVKISLCFSNVAAHEKLKYLAFHDPLTGLINRGVMDRILTRECERAKRYNSELCLVFFDLDNFKKINDTYGHDKGDHALIITANIFDNLKRGSDIIARYAGDEFVAILPSTKLDQAEEFVIRVKKELFNNPVETEDNSFHIYTSHGVASFFEDNCKTPSELLKKADIRLYHAKKIKKNKP